MAKNVVTTDATVLLLGETGTGKEVFAQAVDKTTNSRIYSLKETTFFRTGQIAVIFNFGLTS
ncbi:sigma 54-interacting transcriptional regulator [Segetibacter koreensis]|uniref:sigma 54-interacting transcriptional regulator n=1 Tax=Segetibacter koreensis TaxID=398037 RepID=UPI00036887EB|nr:sigma 54-interacting transcriptional regulator [Segetibacter koreensis]